MDDGFLVEQTLNGNQGAFRLLVLRWQRPIFRFLGLLGLTPAAAEDVAQEAFLRAHQHLASFDSSQSSFSTWLFTIAKRLAANELRRAHHRRERPTAEPDDAFDPAPNPAEAATLRQRGLRLGRELERLPETLRAALVLAQIEGLSLDEVATLEECAVGTVKSRIFRARALLREALVDEESPE